MRWRNNFARIGCCGAILAAAGSHRFVPKAFASDDAASSSTPSAFEEKPEHTEEGIATWYDVPAGSIPARRAPGELTAANDTLPVGTYVRVTELKNNLSVIVRITDHGVHETHAIDLSREAAAEIGLVGRGRAHVRIEILKPKTSLAADTSQPKPAAPAIDRAGPAPSP